MKKLLLLLALVLPLFISSCGDDNNDVLSPMEQDLVGEWAIINAPNSQARDIHYVFKKERTGSRRILENGEVVNDVPFNWTLEGSNRLTLSYAGQQTVLDITLTLTTLHIVYVATGATEDYSKYVRPETED
ncbi:MAG: hypothetical protein J6X22_05295 [Muribaculaceae bacterium]|nr:hypothetical protein [Muribaculaceae bacterium]